MVIRDLCENRSVKKHTSYDGLDLSIEIPKGSYRSGTNHQGVEWSQKMGCHYGYIKLTGAPDGDHLDCYLRAKPTKNAPIWVVHQLTPDGSAYDEDKVMLGFDSRSEATRAWREHAFRPTKMMGTVSEWNPEHFRAVVHACRNSRVIMAREASLDELHRKGVDLGGCKLPNVVLKRLSESADFAGLRPRCPTDVNTRMGKCKDVMNNVKWKDVEMAENDRKHAMNAIMEWREGLKNLQKNDYTSKLMENFRSELHKYSEYETEYRKAELEAMPTWQLAQHMSTLNESAELSSSRVELIEQILSNEGHKK